MTQQLLVITAADLATIQGEIAEIRRILEGRRIRSGFTFFAF